MSTEKKVSLQQRKHKERQRLPNRVQMAEQAGTWMIALSIIVICVPFFILLGYEIGNRIVDPPLIPLSVPWKAYSGPYPPLSEFKWTGDLTRMARIPFFLNKVKEGPFPERFCHRITDEWGFVNRPTGEARVPIDETNEIILTGTSYMAEGSTIEKTLASRLEDKLNRNVYNAAWPSAGPAQSVLKVLTDANFCQNRQKLIILGVIQRYLYSWAFEQVFQYLEEDGSIIKTMPTNPTADPQLEDYLNWRKTIENHMERTSPVRKWAALYAGRPLPPMVFDRGLDAPVSVSNLTIFNNAPILFYTGDIASTYHSYQAREGDRIVEAIKRIKACCSKKKIDFLMILVPDKYEVYRNHLNNPLYSNKRLPGSEWPSHPDRRAPEVLVEQLEKEGIAALDLYTPLYQQQFRKDANHLLYWVNDTHWSDEGIEIASDELARYLRANMQK